MGLYNALIVAKREYYKLAALENKYSVYSITEISEILKILLTSYEKEEYQSKIDDNKLLIFPLDKASLSLNLKIDISDKKRDRVVISSNSINDCLFINFFQRNMHVNYIQKFLRKLVDYRYANNRETLDKEVFEEFFSNYLIENATDIKKYQDEKINCMNKYLEEKKEASIKACFIVDKYDFIFRVKDFINMNYNTTFNVFSETSGENYYHDNNFDYCEFYRTMGLKDSEDNIAFKIKELSYIDKKYLDERYSSFFYDGSKCFDKDINFYNIINGMKDLVKKYPLLKEYFLKLDSSYRKIFADNLGIVDSEKVKELIKS